MKPRQTLPRIVLAYTVSVSVGCGGGGPTSPTAMVPLAPTITSTTAPDVRAGNTATFTVSQPSGSITNYVVEIGKASTGNEVAIVTRPDAATTFSVPLPATGVLYARVYAVNAQGRSPASNEVLLGSYDPRSVIEAYFFGFGPLAVVGDLGGGGNAMTGYQYGSNVVVEVASSVTGVMAAAVTDSVPQFAEMSLGAVTGSMRNVPDPGNLRFRPADGTMFVRAAPVADVEAYCGCAPGTCGGCASSYFNGRFKASTYITVVTNATGGIVAHELGHGLGLAHIRSAAGLTTPGLTLGIVETSPGVFANPPNHMGKFDPATIKAFQAVYAAGMESGATRNQALAAGLISSVGSPASLRDGGMSVDPGIDLWAMRGKPQAEIDRAAESIYGKGATLVFDKNGDSVLTRRVCSLPESK